MESRGDVLSILGALTAAWLLLRVTWGVARTVYVYLLPQVRLGNAWLQAQGAWAVVTGATSGIGKAYAHELARRGLNVVLISRSLSKLEQEAQEIERLYGRSTCIIQADFTKGLEIYSAIEAGLRGLEIGVLVNNVGMMYGGGSLIFRKLLECKNSISDIINCNAMSVAQAFVQYFSEAVCAEYFSKGVTIQTVSPMFVSTNMVHNMPIGLFVKDANEFAREALDTLGLASHVVGCFSHAVQSTLLPFVLPKWFMHSRGVIHLISEVNKAAFATVLEPQTT